jgi:hypothetical protein
MKGCAQPSPRHESVGYVYVASLPFNVPKSGIRLLSPGSADVRAHRLSKNGIPGILLRLRLYIFES